MRWIDRNEENSIELALTGQRIRKVVLTFNQLEKLWELEKTAIFVKVLKLDRQKSKQLTNINRKVFVSDKAKVQKKDKKIA